MFGALGFVIGILLGIFGIFMVIFFPTTEEHQDKNFTISGIVIGLVSLVLSFVLVFL